MTKEDKREMLDMLLDIVERARWSDRIMSDYVANAFDTLMHTIFDYRAEFYSEKETEDD